MEMSLYSTVLFIVIVIEFSLAIVIYFSSKKLAAKLFTITILLHVLWSSTEAIFHGNTNPEIANLLIITTHYVGGLIASAFFYFTLVYPENKKPRKKVLITIIIIQLLLIIPYKQGLIVGDVFSVGPPQQWGWYWGSLAFIFHFTFFGFWLLGLTNIYKKMKQRSGPSRKNMRNILFWMFLSVVPISTITIGLPIINIFEYAYVGSITSLVWVLILALFIIKQYRLNPRAVLAEVFILAASIILFVSIFMSETEEKTGLVSSETVVRTTVFIAFFVVGYMLIVNILKESEQKEKIEQLNKRLGSLNTELEEKVDSRTKELNTSKKHIEIILENLTLGIVEYNSDFEILRVNKATEQMLGISRGKTVNKKIKLKEKGELISLSKIIYDWQTEKVEGSDSRGVIYNELKIKYPKHRELQIITIPIRTIPLIKISGFIKLIRDVTYEKSIDRSKSDFISIVAHQLSASLEATNWALEKILSEKTTPKQKELLEKTQDSNENITQITADLLNTARIDGNEFTFNFEKHNIVRTIENQLKNFEKKAKKKKVELKFENKTASAPQFLFDKEKILLALKNILTNAIDYTPKGGRVSVILQSANDGYLEILIEDTGIGIPKEELDRLFTKFYRSKEALLMETDRSGLGLYITKNIIDGHEGTIDISSEKGSGTTVKLRLPVRIQEEKEDN